LPSPIHIVYPALKILQHEGFRFHGYVDIFDAGPTVETYTKDIKTLHDSKTYTIQSTSDAVNGKNYLIANTDNFCTTLAPMIVCKQNKTCILSKETSNFLQLKLGDKVRATIFKDVNHA
jgi:arginine N-succinyltransferase